MAEENPYASQPGRAFWRPAISERHFAEIEQVWDPIDLDPSDAVATAGSCFAQQIGRRLKRRGANYMDFEPAPDLLSDDEERMRFGFGIFSCRYGNIYTSRQLRQLIEEAFGKRTPEERIWTKNGQYFDALRPNTDPIGQASAEIVLALRERHLAAVRRMFRELDLFVFTLGLTECWEAVSDGTVYPTAPGTICGKFSSKRYRLRNLTYPEIREDMEAFFQALRKVNRRARMLLTVSPVPMIATATDDHVLVATSYTKSTLRAVAGDLAASRSRIFYFPAYEIVSSHPARAAAYNPGLRTVNNAGIDFVMDHFFSGKLGEKFPAPGGSVVEEGSNEVLCDEEELEGYID